MGSDDGRLQESEAIDEARRQEGLAPVRATNIRLTFEFIAKYRPLKGLRLLDVGCAYGWFLLEAARAGMVGIGIEPDPDIAAVARRHGLDVRTGYFPGAIDRFAIFDVISFNDVLEHLADLNGTLEHCRSILAPNGMVLIAAPSSEGVLYRIAIALRKVGLRGPLGRLWQEGFPSPHISYFSPQSLDKLLERHGFELHGRRRLRTVSARSLRSRIGFDSRHKVSPVLAAAILAVAAPAINRVLPADILLSVYRTKN